MEEIWKDIPQYMGLYQASDIGRIKSVAKFLPRKNSLDRFYPEKILKGYLTVYGYRAYKVWSPKGMVAIFGHRLVAYAFLPQKKDKPFINHKNSNRDDNRVENLEWCNHTENMFHSISNKNKNHASGQKNHMSIPVFCMTTGIYYDTITEAHKSGLYRYSRSNFNLRLSGQRPNNTNFIKI